MKRILLLVAVLSMAVFSHATVADKAYSVSFACTGGVGPFSFTFSISDPTALTVVLNGAPLSSANYTVIPINNSYNNGGQVTLNSANACNSGGTLVIGRDTPITQGTKYYENMPTPMTQIMASLDKLTEISQEALHSIQFQNNGVNVDGLTQGSATINFDGCTATESGLPPDQVISYTCGGSPGAGIPGVVFVSAQVGSTADVQIANATVLACANANPAIALSGMLNTSIAATTPLGCASGRQLNIDWRGSPTFVPATDIDMFLVLPGMYGQGNLSADVTGLGGYSHKVVQLSGHVYDNQPGAVSAGLPMTLVSDITCYGKGNTTGTCVYAEGTSNTASYIQFVPFGHINVTGMQYGLHAFSSNNGWYNSNVVQRLGCSLTVYCRVYETSGTSSAIASNTIQVLDNEYSGTAGTPHGIYGSWYKGTGPIAGNIDPSVHMWDWFTAPSLKTVQIDGTLSRADGNQMNGLLEATQINDVPGLLNWYDSSTDESGGIVNNVTGSAKFLTFNAATLATAYQMQNHTVLLSDGTSTVIYPFNQSTGAVSLQTGTTQQFKFGLNAFGSVILGVSGSDVFSVDSSGNTVLNNLQINGTCSSCGGLPNQSGHGGQFLGTDGSTASWSTPSGAGNVNGPGSSTVGHPALWNSATGDLLKDVATLPAAVGGSGQDFSSSTGIMQWAAGTASVSTALANGTTATTQTQADNTTKAATTAYVDRALPMLSCKQLPGNLACNGTVEGAAFQSALNSLSNGSSTHGAVIQFVAGETPNMGSTAITVPIGITINGTGLSVGPQGFTVPLASSYITTNCSDANGCIKWTGLGSSSVSNLTVVNTGTSPCFYVTKTLVNPFLANCIGSAGSLSTNVAVNDELQLGEPGTTTCASDEHCYYLAYGADYQLYGQKIRRAIVANGVTQFFTYFVHGDSTDSNSSVDMNVVSAVCNDAGNKCGFTTLTCSGGATVTFAITGGATGTAACTGLNAMANGTALTLTYVGTGYSAAPTTAACSGTCTGITGTAALTTVVLGPYIDLLGNGAGSVNQTKGVVLGEFGNAASHTNPGDAHFSTMIHCVLCFNNEALVIGDDSANNAPTAPPAYAVFNLESGVQLNHFQCWYRQSSAPAVLCHSPDPSYANLWDDPSASTREARLWLGSHLGTNAAPFNNIVVAVDLATGSNTNNDMQGRKAAVSGSMSFSFSGTYTNAPTCVVQNDTTFAGGSITSKSITNVGMTIGTANLTDQVSWVCTFRN